jgi:hypothetical protein
LIEDVFVSSVIAERIRNQQDRRNRSFTIQPVTKIDSAEEKVAILKMEKAFLLFKIAERTYEEGAARFLKPTAL